MEETRAGLAKYCIRRLPPASADVRGCPRCVWADFRLVIPNGATAAGLKRDVSAGNLEFRCPQVLKAPAIVAGRVGLLERNFVTARAVSPRFGPIGECGIDFSVSPSVGYRIMSVGYPGLLSRCEAIGAPAWWQVAFWASRLFAIGVPSEILKDRTRAPKNSLLPASRCRALG